MYLPAFIASNAFPVMEWWVELSCAAFFVVGFLVMKYDVVFERAKRKLGSKSKMAKNSVNFPKRTAIETHMANGHASAALSAWRTVKMTNSTPLDTLRLVTEALVEQEPAALIEEISEHIKIHRDLRNSRTSTFILEAVAKTGNIALMDELAEVLRSDLYISPAGSTCEVMLGGYAHAGEYDKLSKMLAETQRVGHKLTVRGHCLIIKGYLKNGMVDLAFNQIRDMHNKNLPVPTFALAHLFRMASNTSSVTRLFSELYLHDIVWQVPLPFEVVGTVLEDCYKRNDIEMALRVEKHARLMKTPMPFNAYDCLLKMCIAHNHAQTSDVFNRMQQDCARINDSFCVGLLAKCAECKFLRFAEEIICYIQAKSAMSLVMYSALMKVYAYCGLYDRACDLYPRMRKEGLEPDSVMYGCLMKFSVECGRTDLSKELFEKAPSLDIQNYMSLMRAAARDRDVDRAFAILEKLQAAGIKADKAAYNCVLDACSIAGDLKRARELMEQIKELHAVDVITYNTLLKCYCSIGDLQGARDLFEEMESVGLHPNDVSYNCLINAAVSRGAFTEAWHIIEMMEQKGVSVDKYTLSIVLKSIKKTQDPQLVAQTLAMLDRTGIDVYTDEVLLNNVLETCTKHRQTDRLVALVDGFSRCKINPTVHTYACIIKACSALKQPEKCKDFWKEMTEVRALEPNDIVFGCMLDALVCSGCVDDAVELFRAWKERIPPNTVIYSTLLKGFANSRRAAEAAELLEEMRSHGFKLNTFVYNALIDTHARVGDVDIVGTLLKAMEKDQCSPNSITYSTIVKAYCVKGDIHQAFEVFQDMQSKSMAKDSIVYNTLLEGCAEQARLDLANRVLSYMEKNGIKPSNYTLGSLVKLYGKCHQIDDTFGVIDEFKEKYGITANAKVYTCLIHTCIHNNLPDRALQAYQEMQDSGYTVDAKLYGFLISGCARHYRLEQAISLVETACKHLRNRPEEDIAKVLGGEAIEKLFEALSRQNRFQDATANLIELLREAGVHISGKLLSKAMPMSKSTPNDIKAADRRDSEESWSQRSYGTRKPAAKNHPWKNYHSR